ncbi:hypothetical protein ETAA8_30950 [Anatilimnocola aggregata]|uniref:Uncharacterized protein n=2 Tax=Anatilimnocola aggregata TaxID=2528021 RepID=A0A517YCP3_9BACT|nr:hypothetical protein ETAA8_30950 [Anatilimnocola aggregata]
MPPQAVVTNSAPQTGVAESAAPVVPRLPVEINAQDQLLVSGEATTLDELKATLKDMKNGNSAFAEITVKFAGCSPAKMGETIALLKEACVFYAVDPAGDRPAEDTATP